MAVNKMNASQNPQVKDVTVELVDMTPELAEELLEANTHNRKAKVRSINEYVDALRDGDWQFNGDPVRIAASGRLLDGQHRLMSIVESGVTIPMVVIRGLTDMAQMTMDVGAKRTYGDHLQLNGEINAQRLATIVRTFATYNHNIGKPGFNQNRYARFTMAQLDRLFYANPGLREATHLANTFYEKLRMSHSALGVAYYAMSRIDQEDCDFFWERTVNGDNLSNEGPTQPILKLREYIMDRHKYNHSFTAPTLAALFKTWNAYREGRQLATAVPRLGGAKPEKFPWPK